MQCLITTMFIKKSKRLRVKSRVFSLFIQQSICNIKKGEIVGSIREQINFKGKK